MADEKNISPLANRITTWRARRGQGVASLDYERRRRGIEEMRARDLDGQPVDWRGELVNEILGGFYDAMPELADAMAPQPVEALAEKIGQAVEKAREVGQRESAKDGGGVVVQLPLWPEAVRAVPNGFLRSALFAALGKGGKRVVVRGQEIASLANVTVLFSGQQLDQGDLDVWETLVHFARAQGLGAEIRCSAYQLLKSLQKTDTGGNRKILNERIRRLAFALVEIEVVGKRPFFGHLVDSGALATEDGRDANSGEYVLRIDPSMRVLFESNEFTLVDWEVRQRLPGPLAKWLHGYFSTHAQPHPIGWERLRALSGSQAGTVSKFRQTCIKALGEIREAYEAVGQAFSYEERDGLVRIVRAGTGAQIRHIVRGGRKPKT